MQLLLLLLFLVIARTRRQRFLRRRRLQIIANMRSELAMHRNYFLMRQRRRRQFTATVFFLASQHLRQSAISCRQIWMKERNTLFLDQVVSRWSDTEFKENFRMSRHTYEYLCSELQVRLQRSPSCVREPLSVKQLVAIALWKLGTNSEYRSIGHLFGVGLSSVFVAVREVCEAIVDILLPRYIRIPPRDSICRVADGFNARWGFPQCVGAIDGTHIPIIAPNENALDYYNRKGHHSVIMQALVSFDYTFMDVYIGWPGSVHDARVLTNSRVYLEAEAGTLLPDRFQIINGKKIPMVIIGDPAYPLLPWLMKPFTDTGRLTEKQRYFNYRHSRARMVVECAFGRLKGRWRTLLKRVDIDVKFMPTYVAACCVLHNICEVHKDDFNDEWMVQQQQDEAILRSDTGTTQPPTVTADATTIRDTLSDYFYL